MIRDGGSAVVLIQPTREDLDAMGPNLMSTRNRHATLELARRTTAAQIADPEVGEALAALPKASRPDKVHRPDGPPESWPAHTVTELRPGSPAYETGA